MGRKRDPVIDDSFTSDNENDEEIINSTPIDSPRKPDPAILRQDPLAEMFGPGSTLKLVGDQDDEMPDEIRGVIDEFGLAKKDFQCILKEVPEGSLSEGSDNSAVSVYITSWKRAIPSTEYIAREHGPGSYLLVLSWRVKNDEGTRVVPKREVIPIQISPKCAAAYKKHQLEKKINAASETTTKVHDAIVEKSIEGRLISALTGKEADDKKQSPKEYLEEIMSTVRLLGLPVGGMTPQPQTPKIEWDKILPAIIPFATAALGYVQAASQRKSEEQMKLFMLMMNTNQSSSSQVIEMYKAMAQKPATENPLKELQSMVLSAMDIKELMNPQKETLSDKIFRVVENVAPQILAIAAQSAQTHQPPKGPVIDMAKVYVSSNPDFERLRKDPAEMKKFVDRLDERIGYENADVVLGVVEWERPASCPRDPSKRLPPQSVAEDGEIENNEEVEIE